MMKLFDILYFHQHLLFTSVVQREREREREGERDRERDGEKDRETHVTKVQCWNQTGDIVVTEHAS